MAKTKTFKGACTALITPFRNGEVDWETFEKLIERQIASGTQGLVPCGTTGESPTLSHEEHDKVVAFTVDKAAGRAFVIAGTGSNSTAEAVRLTQHARDAGADGCLVVNPYYNKPTQRGLYEHVAQLDKVGLPIVLYNIPGRTGVEIAADNVVRMFSDLANVVAIKEATGKLDVASAISAGCDITILSGDDSLTLPIGAVGGQGVISVLGNLLPGEIRKLTDAILNGDAKAARKQHLKLFGLFKAMFLETNPIPIKAAMAMCGLCVNDVRLPMTPLADTYRKPLAKMLREFGLDAKA